MRAFSRSSSKPTVRSSAGYAALFDKYKESGSETIGPDGVERLCEDMKVDPSDVKLLVLAWAMGATRMGYFTRDEWMSGVPRFGNATTPPDLLEEVHNLYQALLRDVERFRELYGFTHRFCREERRKTIDVCWRRGPLSNSGESYAHEQPCCRLYPAELLPFCPAAASERHMTLNQQVASAVVMLELLLKPMWPAHIASLSSFMNDHKQLAQRGVLMDEWMMILQFVRQVKPDVSNYQDDGAWPLLLDEYVEWKREKDGAAV